MSGCKKRIFTGDLMSQWKNRLTADPREAAAGLTPRVKRQNMIDSSKTGYDKISQFFSGKESPFDKMMIENTENDRQMEQ